MSSGCSLDGTTFGWACERILATDQVAPLREAVKNLRSPSRLLVTGLLGIVGVAAATSIATFASGTQGASEMGAREIAASSETQLQPVVQQADSRNGWLTLALDTSLPERYFSQLLAVTFGLEEIESGGGRKTVMLLDQPRNADVQIRLAAGTENAESVLYTRFLAPVAPFATVPDDVSMAELTLRWQGRGSGPLIIDADYVSELEAIFGEEAADSVQTASGSALPAVLEVSARRPGDRALRKPDAGFEGIASERRQHPEQHPRRGRLSADGGGGRFWHGERSGRCGAASTHHTADEPQPRQVDDRDHDRRHRDGSRYRISHGDERLRLPCPGDRADICVRPTSHTSAMKCRSWKAVSSTPR